MERLELDDERRFEKWQNLKMDERDQKFKPRATMETVDMMLEKPHIIQQYFEYCGFRFNIEEIKYLCLSFPSKKYQAALAEIPEKIFDNASFSILNFLVL